MEPEHDFTRWVYDLLESQDQPPITTDTEDYSEKEQTCP